MWFHDVAMISVRACMHACVRACVRAWMCVRVWMCVRARNLFITGCLVTTANYSDWSPSKVEGHVLFLLSFVLSPLPQIYSIYLSISVSVSVSVSLSLSLSLTYSATQINKQTNKQTSYIIHITHQTLGYLS